MAAARVLCLDASLSLRGAHGTPVFPPSLCPRDASLITFSVIPTTHARLPDTQRRLDKVCLTERPGARRRGGELRVRARGTAPPCCGTPRGGIRETRGRSPGLTPDLSPGSLHAGPLAVPFRGPVSNPVSVISSPFVARSALQTVYASVPTSWTGPRAAATFGPAALPPLAEPRDRFRPRLQAPASSEGLACRPWPRPPWTETLLCRWRPRPDSPLCLPHRPC